MCFVISLVCSQLWAQTIETDKIDALFKGFVGTNPGISVTIVKGDELVYNIQTGYADIGNRKKVNRNTLFNVASVSKHITGYWINELYLKSKLNDLTPLSSTLPDIDGSDKIQIQHLLRHTSGLREFHTIGQLYGRKSSKSFDAKTIYGYLNANVGLSYTPGSKHTYSNSGYFVLYEIAKSFQDWSDSRLGKKLKNSFWEDKRSCKDCAKLYSYTKYFSKVKFRESVGGYSNYMLSVKDVPTLLSTILSDSLFIRFASSSHSEINGERVPYNYGLRTTSYKDEDILEHGGIIKGSRSHVRYFPEANYGILVMMNSDVIDPKTYVNKISDILLNKEEPEDEFVTIQGYTSSMLNKPLPFINIYSDRSKGPIVSNDTGMFSYNIADHNDSLFFSSLSNQVSYSIDDFDKPRNVVLTNDNSASISISTEGVDKSFETYSFAPHVGAPGSFIVNRIENFKRKHTASLKKLKIFVTDHGNPNAKIRLVAFDFDENEMPGQLVYQSEAFSIEGEGNVWVNLDSLNCPYLFTKGCFVGIQHLEASGRKGKNGVFIGFAPDDKGYDSYYQVPFDEWRSVGEVMYRSAKNLLIEAEFDYHKRDTIDLIIANDRISENRLKLKFRSEQYLIDTSYHTIMPYHLDRDRSLLLEVYPFSRVIKFDNLSANKWKNPNGEWVLSADIGPDNAYTVLERVGNNMAHQYKAVSTLNVRHLYRDQKWVKLKTNNGIKWKVRRRNQDLEVRLKAFRRMTFRHYADNIYYLEGDHTFGRTLSLSTLGEGRIESIQYNDSRNHKIVFKKY